MKREGFGRFTFLGFFLTMIAVLMLAQIVHIQVSAKTKEVSVESQKLYVVTKKTFYPERGIITDRYGRQMATNKQVYQLGVNLQDVVSPVTIASTLASVAGLDYNDVYSQVSQPYVEGKHVFVDLRVSVNADKKKQLETIRDSLAKKAGSHKAGDVYPSLAGLTLTPHLQRSYPEGTVGSNIVGFYKFLDRDGEKDLGRGYYGVEGFYNDLLAGKPQTLEISWDPNHAEKYPDIPPGASLILTIDRDIQAMAEKVVDETMASSQSDSVTIVIADPTTGEVLAMASSPRLDPNQYWNYEKVFKPITTPYNRAISQTYEPGSVFKVLTMSAGFDSGAVDLNTTYLDTGGIEVGGQTIVNWDHIGHGYQNMQGCMGLSLNVCLAWVATEIGVPKYYKYLEAFGIGRRTDIDLAGEAIWPLLLPGDTNWTPVQIGTNAYGQGVATTPIQMVMAVSAVANHGEMLAPHVLKAMIINGKQYDTPLRTLGHPIKAETADTITELLARSLEEEASSALVDGYRVAGKTGTASISVGNLGYVTNLTNASFVGWGPVDDPRFVVYVWLEKPKTNPWGSIVASPVFSSVVRQLVVLMNIPNDAERQRLYGQ
jgi:cell division protein FtsI/penicillin-binding protein 2